MDVRVTVADPTPPPKTVTITLNEHEANLLTFICGQLGFPAIDAAVCQLYGDKVAIDLANNIYNLTAELYYDLADKGFDRYELEADLQRDWRGGEF